MSEWIGDIYKVNIDELDNPRAVKFANDVVDDDDDKNNTYKRYPYELDRRKEVVKCGKLAEQAFALFLYKEFGIKVEIDYRVLRGTSNVDKNDIFYLGLNIDVKSSKDTKNEGIDKCISYFNFPVPVTQTIKDITVSVIYDFDVENFYIISWVDSLTYKHNKTTGEFKNEQSKFNRLPLSKGYKIKDIKIIFDEKCKFIDFIITKKIRLFTL